MTTSNPSVPLQNPNKSNWLSGCILTLLAIFFGLWGVYDLVYDILITYIFFSSRMLSPTTVMIVLLVSGDCIIYFILAFRIKRQRWYVSLALLAVAWLVLSLPLAYLINTATMRLRNDGYSMEPALPSGSYILVNRQAYERDSPQRGDLVVFRSPLSTKPDELSVKRIIGLPGETIRIDQGQVLVNGVPLYESYISAQAVYKGEWKIPKGQYFLLGDNRNESRDSHLFGLVPRKDILAKAVWIYWPYTQFGKIPKVNFAH